MSTSATISADAMRTLASKTPRPVLIDVRTPGEYRAMHVDGAHLHPLDELDPRKVRAAARDGEPLYLLCHAGQRARQAQAKLAEAGVTDTVVVEGGTQACEAAGVPVIRGRGVIPLQRQALIGAGIVVWTGLLLGWFVSPWFLLITAFAGCGLIVAGSLDICLMAVLLSRMPWNRGGARVTCDTAPL